jgi:hypothetical protein
MCDNEETDWEFIENSIESDYNDKHIKLQPLPQFIKALDEITEESIVYEDGDNDTDNEIEQKANAILSSSTFIKEKSPSPSEMFRKKVFPYTQPIIHNIVFPIIKHQTKNLIKSRFVWSQAALWMIRFSWNFDWRINMMCSSFGMCILAMQNRTLIHKLWWKNIV